MRACFRNRIPACRNRRSLRSDRDAGAEGFDLPGLPLDAVGPAVRQGTLSLSDAARSAPDFVFRFTLPGSAAALRAMLQAVPCAGVELLDVLAGRVLAARSRHGPG